MWTARRDAHFGVVNRHEPAATINVSRIPLDYLHTSLPGLSHDKPLRDSVIPAPLPIFSPLHLIYLRWTPSFGQKFGSP